MKASEEITVDCNVVSLDSIHEICHELEFADGNNGIAAQGECTLLVFFPKLPPVRMVRRCPLNLA